MTHSVRRIALIFVFGFGMGFAPAQDPQLEPPKNPAEFFDAVEYELNTGKYNEAAFYLQGLIASNPTDKDFADLERRKGMAAFLRLRNVARWSDDPKADAAARQAAEQLIQKVTAATRAELGDPERVRGLIAQLRATPEERAFALRELQRSGGAAVPHLIDVMRGDPDPMQRALILNVLPLLYPEAVPAILAAVDMDDAVLKVQLINAVAERRDLRTLIQRAETNPLPTFDFLANDPSQSPEVRRAATVGQVKARGLAASQQPIAKVELTRAADDMWRHKAQFTNPQSVPIWRWEGNSLKLYPATAGQAEEYLGLRFARWALQLDPAYEPAQIVFLSLAAEKAMERAGFATPLSQAAPDVNELLSTVYIGALNRTLAVALAEKRSALALGIIRAMAPRGNRESAAVLSSAVIYPDRRVALAAADALLRLPPYGVHSAHARIVEVLRRALAADADVILPTTKRILVAHFDPAEGEAIANAVRAAGYEAVVVRTGREAMRRLKQAADIDGIILDHETPYPQLEDNLASMRYDVHVGHLPLRVSFLPLQTASHSYLSPNLKPVSYLAPPEGRATGAIRSEARLNRLIASYKQVAVVAAPWSVETVRREFGEAATVEQPAGSPALSPEERKTQSLLAIEWLRRMAAGEIQGYDPRPATREILLAMDRDDLAKPAIDAAGRLPGREPQSALANLVLNTNRPVEVRTAAAEALVRHAQRHGNALEAGQTKALLTLLPTIQEPPLRTKVAIAIGILQATQRQSGERLLRFLPPPPLPPMAVPPTTPPAAPPAENPA